MLRMNNLVWIDMEFSGLDPGKDVVLEIASAVTDSELNIIAEGPDIVVHQPDGVLEGMDEWNRTHHQKSGLTEQVRKSRETVEGAQRKTLEFLKKHVKKGDSPLCGNSVHVDRLFMKKHMPGIDEYLHYRIIDVSTIKELVRRWYPKMEPYKKEGTHRAAQDIIESINELRHYRENVFVK